jgi:hypothetical protein
MTHVRGVSLLVLVVVAAALGGCGAALAPINEVPTTAVVSAASPQLTREEVRAALIRALATKGWQVLEDDAAHLTARVSAGGHWAIIHIPYSESSYAIHYIDSSPGLKYDGSRIHRRYNHWIHLLSERINAELANTPHVAPPAAGIPAAATAAPAPTGAPPAPPAPPAAP